MERGLPDADERVREARRNSEERYRFLTENLPVQVWTATPDGNLDYVTDQTARHFGLTAPRLLADGWQNVVHPDDLPLAVERWIHAIRTGETYEVEFRLRLATGLYAWHLARAVPHRNAGGAIVGWLGTNTNIEEQRDHQRRTQALLDEVAAQADQLRHQNRLLGLGVETGVALTRAGSLADALRACADAVARHLDAAFVGIWTIDDAAEWLELQASGGTTPPFDEVHARVPAGRLAIGKIAAARRPRVTPQGTGDPRVSQEVEDIEASEDAEKKWAVRDGLVAFAGYPLVVGDAVVGVIAARARHPFSEASLFALESVAHGLAQAIRRHRAEAERGHLLAEAERAHQALRATLDERERLLESTDEARRKAELASRTKDEFLATASHELRTPLNAILGWARILRGGAIDAAGLVRGLETIERNAKAQVQLIEDILDGSRIITGKLHLEIRPVDLAEVLRSALDAVRPSAVAKNIALGATLDRAAGRMTGDADRLQQVVWNLVTNAIKFTPKGGKVDVVLERKDKFIVLLVKDTGLGIRADFLPHVFERFRQADATTTRRHGGLGLGLALVRHLVESHGGTVRVESEGEGRGATFVVMLPGAPASPEAIEASLPAVVGDTAPESAVPNSLDGISVLVIDDEPDARDLVATVLRTRGADVMVAASVEQALDLLERRSPRVLVSDIGMPVVDGYSLLRRIRALGTKGAQIPALALTAYAREEDRRRALEAGFQTYVAKPVEPDTLVRMVAELARGAVVRTPAR